ncbi:hypothetical protein I79_015697 [Cricetulus griseus]|uniref:Uncharacterized protein n=1 Tax=Cricetulus griseus TaxID=10029 RepID=G3HXH4_CRIGR|nr:hypothetical protein I79_015697 [Cricetulus griseus]
MSYLVKGSGIMLACLCYLPESTQAVTRSGILETYTPFGTDCGFHRAEAYARKAPFLHGPSRLAVDPLQNHPPKAETVSSCLKEITALRNEVLENRLGQTTIVQQVEQKLDDKLGSVSNTLKTKLSDEMQGIYDKINTERSSMSEALEAKLSEGHDQLKNICTQLETQIGNVTHQLDAKYPAYG